jgi:hypothetical protein
LLTLCALTACLSLAARGSAQDLLGRFKEQNEIQAQKVEAEVNQALADARRLAQTNPETALSKLRKCRELLEDAPALTAERRALLLQRVNERLRSVEASQRQQQEAAERAAVRERPREQPRPSARQRLDDQYRDFTNKGRDAVGSAEANRRLREERLNRVGQDIVSSSIPPAGDFTYPKDWKERSERRKKRTQPQLTAAEKNLLRALNSVLSVNFDKTSFQDAINYLQQKTNTTIILDKGSLQDVEVRYDDPITFSAPKVSFRTILRKVLGDQNLTYILKDGVIQVVTHQKARETLVTRSYPIEDFASVDPRLGPFAGPLAAAQQGQMIVNLIQTTIEPASWAVNGGPGTIMYNPATRSLVIRQSAEMHYSLGGVLGN